MGWIGSDRMKKENENYTKKFETIKLLGNYLLKNAWWYVLLLIIIILISSVSLIIHTKTLELIINSISSTDSKFNLKLIIIWALSIFAANLFSLCKKYIIINIDNIVDKHFTPVIINKYSKLAYSEFENSKSQNILQNINPYSYKKIIEIFSTLLNLLYAIITLLEIIIIFSTSYIYIGIISIIIIFPLIWYNSLLSRIESKQRWNMTKDIRKRYYFQSLFSSENSLEEIKIFDSKKYFINQSDILTEKINKELKQNISKVTKLKIICSVITCLFVMMVIILSIYAVLTEKIQLGAFIILIECIPLFINAENSLVTNITIMLRNSEDVKIILKFLSLPDVEVKNTEDTQRSIIFNDIAIEFENVSFSYPNSNKIVLKNISFHIKKGEIVSFVGANGSGKSTIIKLICGLYKPNKGIIRINGKDVSCLSIDEIKNELAVCFQDGQRYQLSVRENIGIGNLKYINDDEKLKNVLELVGAENIFDLKDGLDQKLGLIDENAVDLSGGEWQRLILSRALISSSEIIILDEPTSSLDPIAESDLYGMIYQSLYKNNKTAILISHRLASCVFSKRIIVLKDGEIFENGSHEELMDNNQYYSEMFKKQQMWYK